jgi:tRNA A-37 threonylcarbamoyl transferase component Bud32
MDANGRYVLGGLIGEGATACVYEAQDTVLQREVAVKVFRDIDIGGSTSERIDEEARILARLAHPHLLPVYDTGCGADGRRFIVMPLVRGTTLAKLLTDGPVDPREVKQLGAALAGALAHIHAQGIVHRDVKPSNVLLADDGTPYLADFGFARAVDGPALTATDCIVGTAGYAGARHRQRPAAAAHARAAGPGLDDRAARDDGQDPVGAAGRGWDQGSDGRRRGRPSRRRRVRQHHGTGRFCELLRRCRTPSDIPPSDPFGSGCLHRSRCRRGGRGLAHRGGGGRHDQSELDDSGRRRGRPPTELCSGDGSGSCPGDSSDHGSHHRLHDHFHAGRAQAGGPEAASGADERQRPRQAQMPWRRRERRRLNRARFNS